MSERPPKRALDLTGTPLPPSVAALGPEALAELDACVDEAYRRQGAELRAARSNALKTLPWPLRKVVGKVLGG